MNQFKYEKQEMVVNEFTFVMWIENKDHNYQ